MPYLAGEMCCQVRELVASDQFDITNPNSCYAALGAFGGTASNFHAADGSGYAFYADMILKVSCALCAVAPRSLLVRACFLEASKVARSNS